MKRFSKIVFILVQTIGSITSFTARADCLFRESALHAAVRANDILCIQALLEKGVPVDTPDEEGRTALMLAARQGSLEILEMLLKANASPHSKSKVGQATALFWAARHGHTSVVNQLLKAGAHADEPNAVNESPLLAAATWGHFEIVKALIKAKADVNRPSKFSRRTPLILVSFNGGAEPIEVTRVLLEAGANPNAADFEGKTAAAYAAHRAKDAILEILLKHPHIEINSRDINGFTPLLEAVRSGCGPRVIEDMVGAGAKLTDVNRFGEGVVYWAAVGSWNDEQRLKTLEALKKLGAPLALRTSYGLSPRDAAARFGNKVVVTFFDQAGVQ